MEQPFLFGDGGGGGGGSGGDGVSSSEDSSKFSSSSLVSSIDSPRSYDPLKDSSLSTFQCWVDIIWAALATPLPLAGELSLGRFLLGARIFLLLFFGRVELDEEDEDDDEDEEDDDDVDDDNVGLFVNFAR